MRRFLRAIGLTVLALLLAGWIPAPQQGETTDDPSAVTVSQLHIFLRRAGDRLQVHEYYLIGNSGDRTYIGREGPDTGQRLTLVFPLPTGAANLTVDEGMEGRFVLLPDGLADTEPIPPGMATVEVSFQYDLPYQEGMEVVRTFPAPVASVVLLGMEGDLALEGQGVTSQGALQTPQGTALAYTAGPIPAGGSLSFRVQKGTTVPAGISPAAGGPTRNPAAEIVIGLVALAAAGVVAYGLSRSPAPGPIPPLVRPLIEAIAALDADYEAGRVGEKEYRRRREALQRQAREAFRKELHE